MIIVTARYKTKKGMRTEYIKAITQAGIISESRNEAGNISYEYFCPVDDDDEIFIFERWKDEEALNLHKNAPHFLAIGDIKKNYVTSDTKIEMYTVN